MGRRNETWKPVRGYEKLYEVSNEGRVRSLNYRHTGKTKEMRAVNNGSGYLLVGLCMDGKVKLHLVHRLAYEAFRGKIPDGMQINHLDENKLNNCLENLELCTRKENCNYGTRNERVGKAIAKVNINNPLRSKAVNQIDRMSGEVINTFPSIMEVYRKTGIAYQSISQCCKGKRQSAGGFVWKYAV